MQWNKRNEPISERLRDKDEIIKVISEKTMIYNPRTKSTALISEVYEVEHDDQALEDGYSPDEDRWVEYVVTDEGPNEDFSVDLDDEGWLWLDELKGVKL